MKKIISILAISALMAAVSAEGNGGMELHADPDNRMTESPAAADPYLAELLTFGSWDNTAETMLPQTIVYKTVHDFLESPLPEGKTNKKAIVLGYDGFRADGLTHILGEERGAVRNISEQGGLYLTFAGGTAGGQATSTSPGWASILTGCWNDGTGVADNGQVKRQRAVTFLTEAAARDKSAAFVASWREHTYTTYREDIIESIENNLPASYTYSVDDADTLYTVLGYVSKAAGQEKTAAEDPDVIFFTFEHTDHAGHSTGFGNQNPDYVAACHTDDQWAAEILWAIENRSAYDTEDWLILITTDHGGGENGHGGQSVYERTTWLASNRAIDISEENLRYERND